MINLFLIFQLTTVVTSMATLKNIENGSFAVDEIEGKWFFNDSPAFHKNFSCIFQTANFDCFYFDNSTRPDYCSKIRYFPNVKFMRTDQVFLFSKFNGSQINLEGDSISSQSFTNLACRLQPYLNTYEIDRERKADCNHHNLCHLGNLSHLYAKVHATFTFDGYSIGVNYENKVVPSNSVMLNRLKQGDIYIFNYGLHLHSNRYSKLVDLIPIIKIQQHAGVHVVWQETIAPQFLTSDKTGLYSEAVRDKQEFFAAKCVNIDQIDRAAA